MNTEKSVTPSGMTEDEQRALSEHETIIAEGLQSSHIIGEALQAIRDQRLYRDKYQTFEQYCHERWGMSKTYAKRQIQAAAVVDDLASIGVIPKYEAQVRPLVPLEPADRRIAWQCAVANAPDGRMTKAHVQQTVNDLFIRQSPEIAFNYKRDKKVNRAGKSKELKESDFCQTPAYALGPILPYLKPAWRIWESAAGEGLLVDGLREKSFPAVLSSDVLTGQDFFEYDPVQWDCLVTNPPYTLKYPWLRRCYELGKPFALLLPVETMGAKKAQVLMRHYGFEIILFSPRVDFKMPRAGYSGGGAQFSTCWFTWGLGIGKPFTLDKLDKPGRKIMR